MTLQVDFLPFATGGGANVEDQPTWATDPIVGTGFAAGLAKSNQLNKAWRQGNFMAAVLANFIANQLNANVLDDGNLSGKITQLTNAIETLISNTVGNFYEFAGNPNGNVAGRAGVVGTNPPDVCYDLTNKILYFCTTTGTTSTAVWSPVTGFSVTYAGAGVGGTANAVTISSTTPSSFTLTANVTIVFTPTSTNGGATTLNVNSTGVITCQKNSGGSLVAFTGGEFTAGEPVTLTYNGSVWVLQGGVLGTLAAMNLGFNTANDGSNNLVAQVTGQCSLVWNSVTQLTLYQRHGSSLVINGVARQVPSAGITLANTSLAASTNYFVYAEWSSGTMSLLASTTVPTRNSNGTLVMNGDATKALVGYVMTDASVNFIASSVISSFLNPTVAPIATLTYGTTINWATALDPVNPSPYTTGASAQVTLTGNATLNTPTGLVDGQTYTLFVYQDATGGRTLAFTSGSFKWSYGIVPVLTATPNALDIFTFVARDNVLYGVAQENFQ